MFIKCSSIVPLQAADVPKSPAFNVPSAPAQAWNTPNPNVHAPAAGFGVAHEKVVDPQVCFSLLVRFWQIVYGL